MAVVHHAARLVFIAEAHVGGRSVAEALTRSGGVASESHHDFLSDVIEQGLVSRQQLDDYAVLSVVRNHFDALVTWWIHRGRGRSFGHFLQLMVTLPDQVQDDRLYWKYFDDSDVVLRYEGLAAQIAAWMQQRAGIEMELPWIGRNDKRDYRSYYTTSERQLVESVFSTELAQLGYTFERSEPGSAISLRPRWRTCTGRVPHPRRRGDPGEPKA